MSLKLLENIIINNESMRIIYAGAKITEATIDLDSEQEIAAPDSQDTLMDTIQQWINKNKASYGNSWNQVVNHLQPAIDAIHSSDIESLKIYSSKLADKANQLSASNPKSAQALDRIHTLYRQLLSMSRDSLGESYNSILKIVVESHNKIKKLISK